MFSKPLVSTQFASRREFSEIVSGDLITVVLYNPATKQCDLQAGARVKRIDSQNVWVSIAGIDAPSPYQIGDPLVLGIEKVIDW